MPGWSLRVSQGRAAMKSQHSAPRLLPWGHDPGAYHVALLYNYTILHTGILRFTFDDHHNVKGFAHFFFRNEVKKILIKYYLA